MQISCIGCNKTTEDIHDKSILRLINTAQILCICYNDLRYCEGVSPVWRLKYLVSTVWSPKLACSEISLSDRLLSASNSSICPTTARLISVDTISWPTLRTTLPRYCDEIQSSLA